MEYKQVSIIHTLYNKRNIMIHIACNIDNNYIMQCCTTLESVMYNNKEEQIVFHIIAKNLNNDARRTISEEVAKYHQQVHFYSYEISKSLPTFGSAHISTAAYLRLFTADILPIEIHKVLYLDCDLIVNGPIKDLWNIDITSYAVGAVEDMWSGKSCYYTRLEYPQEYTYFNSGVLLINLDYWRKPNPSNYSMKYASEHAEQLIFNDQDILNALLYNKKLLIPFRWNIQDGHLRKKRRIRSQAIPKLLEELRHPIIIHYTGHRKPWLYICLNPYKQLFFKYLDMTLWKGYRPAIPISWKIKTIIDKVLYTAHLKAKKYDDKNCITL